MILGSFGSSQINIGLNVHLRDNFSGPAAQVKAAFGSLKDELRMYQDNLRTARNMYGSLFAAGSIATMGMATMYKTGAKFDYVIRGAAAAAGASKGEFKQMFDMANKIGGTTMFTPAEAGAAMRELSLANFNAKETLIATQPIINLAGASMTNLATSAQIAVNTMYQFNKKASDMGHITDLLTYASNKSAINLTDLGESLKYVSATGIDLGQNLPDVLSMLMVLGNAGLKGSIAGVGLENMMRYMALGLGEYAKKGRSKTWSAFGLDPKQLVDAKGNLKPVVDIFKAMSVEANKFGNVDKQNLLYQIFNVRGKRGASKLLQSQEQWDKYIAALKKAEQEPGFAKNIMEFMMAGPEGDIERMKGAWLGFANQFTQAVAPLATVLLKTITGLTKIFTWIAGNPVGKILTAWVAGVILLKTAIWGVKFAFASVALSQSYLAGSFAGVKTAMMTGWYQLIGASRAYGNTLATNAILGGAMAAGKWTPMKVMAGQAAAAGLGGYFMGAGGRVFQRGVAGGITRVAAGATVNSLRTPGFGAGIGRNMFFKSTVGAGAAAGLLGGVGGRLATKLGAGVFSKALGFFGGPWGLALTAGLTVLPLLFSSLSNKTQANTEATAANTATTAQASADSRLALAKLSDAIGTKEQEVRNLYARASDKNMANYLLERRAGEYMANPKAYGDRKFYDMQKPGVVNVYVAGKLTETINHELNKQLNVILNP